MQLTVYQIDAFASALFTGNPAAVVPLERWLPDAEMQSIAMEFNLSETVFFVREGSGYRIRWFTPLTEVKLCGHATLAAAWVLYHELDHADESIEFFSLSGPLTVTRSGGAIALDFPAQPPRTCAIPDGLSAGLGAMPTACLRAEDYVAVFACEQDVAALQPDFARLARLDSRGVIATAPGDAVDFVLRFFAPRVGIDEDPVTGSAFTILTPYWAQRLGKSIFSARQISARGGNAECALTDGRVQIAGAAIKFMQGTFEL